MITDKFFLSLWGVGKRRALVPPAFGYVDLALGFQCHEEVYVQTMVLQCSRVPTCSMSANYLGATSTSFESGTLHRA
jgi:hypothetical protein